MHSKSHASLRLGALVALASLASAAHSQWWNQWWADNFNSYAVGPLAPNGGWQRFNFPTPSNPNADVVINGSRVLRASFMSEVVRPVSNFSTGNYIFSSDFYVQSTSGHSYLSLMNAYTPNGVQTWGSILRINGFTTPTNGSVTWLPGGPLHQSSPGVPAGGGPATLTVPWGWNSVRSEVNLFGNTISTYINGVHLATHPWKADVTHSGGIAAVHVAGFDAPGNIDYDHMCLTPSIPRDYLRGLPDNFGPNFVEPPLPSAGLISALNTTFPGTQVGFDQTTFNAVAASSINGLPTNSWLKGTVTFRAKSVDAGGTDDLFYFWTPPNPAAGANWLYQNRYDFANGGPWLLNTPRTFTYNLQSVPSQFAASNGKNLLAEINQKGNLSIFSRDDTALDYWRLRLWSCRPNWKDIDIVTSGNVYTYALPTGQLQIDPGSAGGSGSVTFDTQNSSFVEAKFADNSVNMSPGKSYNWQVNARIGDGVGNVATTRASRVGDFIDLRSYGPGMTNIATKYRGYRNGAVVTHGTISPGGALSVAPGQGMSAATLSVCETSFNTGCDPTGWTPNQPLAVAYRPASGLYRVNGVDVSEIVLTIPVHTLGLAKLGGVTDVTLTPQFFDGPVPTTIEYLSKGAFGLQFGQAFQEGAPDPITEWPGDSGVVVTNTSGTGGVVTGTSVGVACAASASWYIPGEDQLPDGSALSLDHTGVRSDGSSGPIGSLTFTKNGSQRDVTADFSALGANLVKVTLFDGVVPTTLFNVNPSQIGSITGDFPISVGTFLTGSPLVLPEIKVQFASAVTLTHNMSSYNVTKMFVYPQGASLGVSSISGLGVDGQDIGEIILTEMNSCHQASGRIAPAGFVGSLAGTVATIQIKNPVTRQVISTQEVPLDADGNYTIESEWFGEYDLVVDARSFLKTSTPVYLTRGRMAGMTLAARNGDADNSGEVDAADIDLVISKFGSVVGDPGFNPNADVDGSTEVDAADIDLVIANFGAVDDN